MEGSLLQEGNRTVWDGLRQPKRLAAVLGLAILAAVIPLIGSLTTGNATSGGDPYSVPEVVDTNPDPEHRRDDDRRRGGDGRHRQRGDGATR